MNMDDVARRTRRGTQGLACGAILLLAGCRSAETLPEPAPAPEPPARDWVAEIKAEAATAIQRGGAFPLADNDVLSLRRRAETLAAEQKYADAERLLMEALSLMSEDPALWQQRAELALAQRDFAKAEEHARKAESLGIDFGELCVRIRLTQAAARTEAADTAGADSHREKARACFPPELPRF